MSTYAQRRRTHGTFLVAALSDQALIDRAGVGIMLH
jgi:hypothetical protein